MFSIIIGDDIVLSENNLTCTIFCIVDKYAFPSDKWTDFGKNVLAWWTESLVSMQYGAGVYHLRFEDGTYEILCKKGMNMRVELHGIDYGTKVEYFPPTEIGYIELVKSVQKAIKTLAYYVHRLGNKQDADYLNKLNRRLLIILDSKLATN